MEYQNDLMLHKERAAQLRKYERDLTIGAYPSIDMSVKGFLDKYFGGAAASSIASPQPESQKQQQEQAKPAPKAIPVLQEKPKTKTFHIFTDGACSDNGRRGARGGFGVYLYSLSDRSLDKGEPLLHSEPQTNNRAELRAIQCALDIVDGHMTSWKDFDCVWIWSDSEYSIHSLTKWADGWRRHGWKKRDGGIIQNLDLIKPMHEQLQKMPRVSLHYVRGHQDAKKGEFPYDGNYQADLLARKGVQEHFNHLVKN